MIFMINGQNIQEEFNKISESKENDSNQEFEPENSEDKNNKKNNSIGIILTIIFILIFEAGKYFLKEFRADWIKKELPKGLIVKLHFTVQHDGTITNITVSKPSGNKMFDDACIQTVKDSSPLEPVPNDLTKEELDVDFSFDTLKRRH